MKPTQLIVLGGLALASTAHAADLEGSVIDAPTRKVIDGGRITVAVTCGSVRKTARTDGAGRFAITGLPAGTCTLSASGGDYAAVTLSVTVTDGAIATILVPLSTRAYVEEQKRRELEMRRRMHDEPVAAPAAAEAPRPDPVPRREPPKRMRPVPAPPRGAGTTPVRAQHAPVIPQQPARLDQVERRPVLKRELAAGDQPPPQVGEWAPVRVFPVPQHTRAYEGPRTDFRETIYWHPSVETDAKGHAEVTFVTSDAVTAFRATAEGFSATGLAGGGKATFQSKLPLTLDAHLPVAVTSGDTLRLPVTITNETDAPLEATLTAQFGAAFTLARDPVTGPIRLRAKEKRSVFFPLQVVATDGDAQVSLALGAGGLTDKLEKQIRVVPRGFPFEASASGTARAGVSSRHVIDLAGALPGSIRATATLYPSPVAAMTRGMDAMIREPSGCFEQTSSSNYPNIMILAYLGANDAADPALVANTQSKLDRGYKLLTGFETREKGYEWFGRTPGHEALTAYGLMEFADMAKVYDVDHEMVARTADWLMSRRDGKGGFSRSSKALDSFGRASEATTNAYIMWALAEAQRAGSMTTELAAQRTLGAQTRDPYLLALAANTNLLAAPRTAETAAMVKRLAGMQAKHGGFPGAKETITMSGGDALEIETTALALLALIKASPNQEYEPNIRAGVTWLNARRSGHGAWSNTQATILGLKALAAYSTYARTMTASGRATLIVNGKEVGSIDFDKGRRDALVWDAFAPHLAPGKNTVEVRLAGGASLPYSIAIDYRSARPASSPDTKVTLATRLLAPRGKMGDGITLRAHVANTTTEGLPMTLARIGIPGGMTFQTWQLQELRDKGLIDFYETRPREVILYWRALAPSAKKDIDLNLLASVPGTYEAPASSAYLYYTAEDKAWTAPLAITID